MKAESEWVEAEDWYSFFGELDRIRAVLRKPCVAYPRWTARIRMIDGAVAKVPLNPELTLDEAKAVVQTLAGAQQ
jgi:hypothetical protein